MINDCKFKTIKEIEEIEGSNICLSEYQEFPLPKWYSEIQNKKIVELSDFDISRCIRQEIYLEYIVPDAIERLFKSPIIGDFYDFEILTKVADINKSFWDKYIEIANEAKELVNFLSSNETILNDYVWFSEEDRNKYFNTIKELKNKLGYLAK